MLVAEKRGYGTASEREDAADDSEKVTERLVMKCKKGEGDQEKYCAQRERPYWAIDTDLRSTDMERFYLDIKTI